MMHEEFEEGGEILTRPRLTREQVDVLESQFQAQPKPNSNVKRQLAAQTKLTLPRVAVSSSSSSSPTTADHHYQNWFQNRRAKAKQMKKQEEFEINRSMGLAEGWKSDSHLPSGYTIPLHVKTPSEGQLQITQPETQSATEERSSTQEAGWASLQRALSAAATAQSQLTQQQEQSFVAMPTPRVPPASMTQTVPTSSTPDLSENMTSFADWDGNASTTIDWPLQQNAEQTQPFDFGFGPSEPAFASDASQSIHDSPEETSQRSVIPAEMWPSSVHTPTAATQVYSHAVDNPSSSAFPLPAFPASRRGSASDELTTGFDSFALAGTPPVPASIDTSGLQHFRRTDGEVDLAARRKRPRPAALGSAALRSRSYGAPPSMSPTFRFGSQTSPHPMRHVKSMGQNLNVRYPGIRKPSSAQRSPLNVATFAEAEEFQKLLTDAHQARSLAPPTPVSSENFSIPPVPVFEDAGYIPHGQETPQQYHFNGQPINFDTASPPITPMKPEFFNQGQIHAMMPPVSAPPQYAVFPDQTPPYSAGPLTSSSWSDAPFTSPQMSYPQMTYMPQVMYPTSAQDFNYFHQFSLPPQPKVEMAYSAPPPEHKPTEFFIQEFPRQKEEHAHAAQQLSQQKPKNYVFSNATPHDF